MGKYKATTWLYIFHLLGINLAGYIVGALPPNPLFRNRL